MKKRTKNLHSILRTCEKIIEYFYHSSRVFIKTLGKVLYNLVFKVDFNFKGIVSELIKYDNKEMYDYVHHLEKNEFLKKNKMFRKMQEKVHFYEKLELPKYQKAYQKIAFSLKDVENIGKQGDLSRLNENSMFMGNNLNMSRNRSVLTRNQHSMNESINQDMSHFNLLDALDSKNINTSMVQRPQNILDLMQRMFDKFKTDKFNDLNFVSVELFVKKLKEFIGVFEENIVTINVDPKNRNEHLKLKENRAEQNYEFYMLCLNEFKQKTQFCESRFKMINLLIQNREIKLEEKETQKMYQLVTTNRTLMNEDKLNSQVDCDAIELLQMIESSYIKKKNILNDKRNFMGHIEQIVNSTKKDLDKVFKSLNRYEDKYMLSIAKHKENKKKIEVNTLQMREMRHENNQMAAQVKEEKKELGKLENELLIVKKEQKGLMESKRDFEQRKTTIAGELKDFEEEVVNLSKENVQTELYLIELEESDVFMRELLQKKTEQKSEIEGLKKKKEGEFNQMLQKVTF